LPISFVSLALRNEYGLKALQNAALSTIFGLESEQVRDSGENFIMGSFIICNSQRALENRRKRGGLDGLGMRQSWKMSKIHTGFGGMNQRKRKLERPRYKWKIITKMGLMDIRW
jgi:hypothetical protein